MLRGGAADGLNAWSACEALPLSVIASSSFAADPGPMPGSNCATRNPGNTVAQIVGPPKRGENILDMRGFKKFETAELHERNVLSRQLDFQRGAVMRRAKQHGL